MSLKQNQSLQKHNNLRNFSWVFYKKTSETLCKRELEINQHKPNRGAMRHRIGTARVKVTVDGWKDGWMNEGVLSHHSF